MQNRLEYGHISQYIERGPYMSCNLLPITINTDLARLFFYFLFIVYLDFNITFPCKVTRYIRINVNML